MGENIKKLLLMLGLAAITVSACGGQSSTDNVPKDDEKIIEGEAEDIPTAPQIPEDDNSAPTNPDGDNIEFGNLTLSLEVGTDLSQIDYVDALSITSSKGNDISTSYTYYGLNNNFAWISPQILTVVATTGEGQKSRNISITWKDKMISESTIYNTLEKSTGRVHVKKDDGKWGSGSGYFIDYNKKDGTLYFATNHHVIASAHTDMQIVIEPNKDGFETNVLPKLCAQIESTDTKGASAGIDMAILKVVGVAQNADCSQNDGNANFSNRTNLFNILKLTNVAMTTHWDGTSNEADYYSIGWPGTSATYTRATGKRRDKYANTTVSSGYKFNMLRISTYMGAGSSGAVFVDNNLNVVGINSQGYSSILTQGIVHASSMMSFINNYYSVKNSAGYDGQFK